MNLGNVLDMCNQFLTGSGHSLNMHAYVQYLFRVMFSILLNLNKDGLNSVLMKNYTG